MNLFDLFGGHEMTREPFPGLPLSAEILRSGNQPIDLDALRAAVEHYCPRAMRVTPTRTGFEFRPSQHDEVIERWDVGPLARSPSVASLHGALVHSNLWRDAHLAVSRCDPTATLALMGTAPRLPHFERARTFNALIRAVASCVPVVGVHRPQAQCIVDPSRSGAEAWSDGYLGTLNFRVFDTSVRDVVLVDTLGLHVFGRPDLQVLVDRSCNRRVVATRILQTAAHLLMDSTPARVAMDGTLWELVPSEAQAAPERDILELVAVGAD